MADWSYRYIELARFVSTWSKDPSTKVGAVIFRPDGGIISLGYNGFPRGVSDSPEQLANRELKLMMTIHAEENAILSAGRNGTPLNDSCIAITHHPCARCAGKIIQSGIKQVYFTTNEELEQRWASDMIAAAVMFASANVEWRRIDD